MRLLLEVELREGKRIVASLGNDIAHLTCRVLINALRAADRLSAESTQTNMFLALPLQMTSCSEEITLLLHTGCLPANVVCFFDWPVLSRAQGSFTRHAAGADQDTRMPVDTELVTGFLQAIDKADIKELPAVPAFPSYLRLFLPPITG
ncbi:hypothetical protein V8E53_002999 [Lactarius tabidus]